MKKIGIFLLALLVLPACSSSTAVNETKDDQYARLLEQAEKNERAKKEKLMIGKDGEIVENPHEGKTRGEIMQYEMAKVKQEMEMLKQETDNYVEKEKKLKLYREKMEKLEKLNEISM